MVSAWRLFTSFDKGIAPVIEKSLRVSAFFICPKDSGLDGCATLPGIQDPQIDRKGEKPKEIF